MKKNIITLSLVLVGLVGLWFFISSSYFKIENKDENKNKSSLQEEKIKLVKKTLNDLKSVTVKNKEDNYKINVRFEGEKINFSLDNAKKNEKISYSITKNFIDELLGLTSERIVENTLERIKEYGLEDKNQRGYILIDFLNGENLKLLLGNEAPLNSGAYLMVENKSDIYLVSSSAEQIFLNNKDYFIEK